MIGIVLRQLPVLEQRVDAQDFMYLFSRIVKSCQMVRQRDAKLFTFQVLLLRTVSFLGSAIASLNASYGTSHNVHLTTSICIELPQHRSKAHCGIYLYSD